MDLDKLIPLHGNFLVRRIEAADKIGSIHIPDAVKDVSQFAWFIRTGMPPEKSRKTIRQKTWDDDWRLENEVEEGYKLLLTLYGGHDISDDLLLVPKSSILGVMMGTQLYPVGRNLLVELEPRVEKVGSIHVPEASRGANYWGTVRRMGGGCAMTAGIPSLFRQRVYITREQGTHYKEGGKDYIIVDERKITMVEP